MADIITNWSPRLGASGDSAYQWDESTISVGSSIYSATPLLSEINSKSGYNQAIAELIRQCILFGGSTGNTYRNVGDKIQRLDGLFDGNTFPGPRTTFSNSVGNLALLNVYRNRPQLVRSNPTSTFGKRYNLLDIFELRKNLAWDSRNNFGAHWVVTGGQNNNILLISNDFTVNNAGSGSTPIFVGVNNCLLTGVPSYIAQDGTIIFGSYGSFVTANNGARAQDYTNITQNSISAFGPKLLPCSLITVFGTGLYARIDVGSPNISPIAGLNTYYGVTVNNGSTWTLKIMPVGGAGLTKISGASTSIVANSMSGARFLNFNGNLYIVCVCTVSNGGGSTNEVRTFRSPDGINWTGNLSWVGVPGPVGTKAPFWNGGVYNIYNIGSTMYMKRTETGIGVELYRSIDSGSNWTFVGGIASAPGSDSLYEVLLPTNDRVMTNHGYTNNGTVSWIKITPSGYSRCLLIFGGTLVTIQDTPSGAGTLVSPYVYNTKASSDNGSSWVDAGTITLYTTHLLQPELAIAGAQSVNFTFIHQSMAFQ